MDSSELVVQVASIQIYYLIGTGPAAAANSVVILTKLNGSKNGFKTSWIHHMECKGQIVTQIMKTVVIQIVV